MPHRIRTSGRHPAVCSLRLSGRSRAPAVSRSRPDAPGHPALPHPAPAPTCGSYAGAAAVVVRRGTGGLRRTAGASASGRSGGGVRQVGRWPGRGRVMAGSWWDHGPAAPRTVVRGPERTAGVRRNRRLRDGRRGRGAASGGAIRFRVVSASTEHEGPGARLSGYTGSPIRTTGRPFRATFRTPFQRTFREHLPTLSRTERHRSRERRSCNRSGTARARASAHASACEQGYDPGQLTTAPMATQASAPPGSDLWTTTLTGGTTCTTA